MALALYRNRLCEERNDEEISQGKRHLCHCTEYTLMQENDGFVLGRLVETKRIWKQIRRGKVLHRSRNLPLQNKLPASLRSVCSRKGVIKILAFYSHDRFSTF